MARSSIYNSWIDILQRCNNTKNRRYKDYGGRGITVCERWLKFKNFLEDMGKKPAFKSQIDRTDNNKGYYKSNCRWTTSKEQSRNRRSNRLITYKNKTQCLIVWSEELDIDYNKLYLRIYRYNWSIEKTFTTP